ncbi:MAG: hypothetical protein WA918_04940 [Erythrobacter sp.]
MSYRLYMRGSAAALFGESPVIQAEEARLFSNAAALLEEALRLKADTVRARDCAIEEGRATGRCEVWQERDVFVAEAIGTALCDLTANIDALRDDIAQLALLALGHILGDLPDDIKIAALAAKAVDHLDIDRIEAIHVAPALTEKVAAHLPPAVASRVEANQGLTTGDCVLLTRSGKVIANLDVQLDKLAERWQVGPNQ